MPITRFASWAAGVAFIASPLLPGPAQAAGLQISPISITMPADQKASEIWLRNTSDEIVHAQVRVYLWLQEQGEDVLTPEQAMVASPPMVQIEPRQQQLVRLVRVGPLAGPAATERAYRLLIDELPIERNIQKAGLNFVFRYSVPVFIAGTTAANPVLDWTVQQKGRAAWLRVANTGTSHAQLANIEFTPTGGKPVMAANGLAGYVLPGHYRNIELDPPAGLFGNGGAFNSLINAVNVETHVGPIEKAP